MTDVTMTIEPEPHGYAQHMITAERSGPEWEGVTGCLFLTDAELDQLPGLIARYRKAQEVTGSAIETTFTDPTGRPGRSVTDG